MISTVFFDVGGTLIHPDTSRLLAPLMASVVPSASHLLTAERAAKRRQSGDGDAVPAIDVGQLGPHAGPVNLSYWQLYFDSLLNALGCCRDLLPELTARAGDSSHWTLVDPAAAPTLRRLREAYRLAVISNADGHIDRVLQQAGLDRYFDGVFDSGTVGYEKPDPRIFQTAMKQMDAVSGQSVYVGDVYAIDYLGATRAGMKPVLLDPNGVYGDWDVARITSLSELPAWLSQQP